MPRLPTRALCVLCLIAVAAQAAPTRAAAQEAGPLVGAASSFRFALEDILAEFRRDTDIEARAVYGSSGNLARQIEQGAPFELFLSADETFVGRLQRKGLIHDDGALYAIGRIALFAPARSSIMPQPSLDRLARASADGTLRRFAIANPEHAPYGRAARQALEAIGLWEAVEPKLVLGENVAQAAQFAASGNADGGIVAYSLVAAPPFRGRGAFAPIPDSLHEPLRQRMALTRGASPEAQRLFAYLRSEPARAIIARHGFALPDG